MREILDQYEPITLDEMGGIKLMNRTDTKFVTTKAKLLQLLRLAQEDYRVQEIEGKRVATYYTVYFDTEQHDMYLTHHNGRLNRQKLRIRSYVDSGLSFLEVKTKNNHKRTKKKRVNVDGFDPVNPRHDIRFLRGSPELDAYGAFLEQYLKYEPETLTQQQENRFSRITLVNKGKTERLTIDTDLRFHNLCNGVTREMEGLVIIELKRDGLVESPVLALLRQLRIKPMGFSKYCMGVAMTNDHVKRNRFKTRIRAVCKMMDGRPAELLTKQLTNNLKVGSINTTVNK